MNADGYAVCQFLDTTNVRVPKMHADEVDTDASLVRRLVAVQFPEWADLEIEPVPFGERTTRFTDSATTCRAPAAA